MSNHFPISDCCSQAIQLITGMLLLVPILANGITIQGIVVNKVFSKSGSVFAEGPSIFQVSSQSNQWQIKIDLFEQDNFSIVAGSDGTQSATITTITSKRNIRPNGLLQSGGFPSHEWPPSRVVWLAFCSSGYFGSGHSNLPALWNGGFKEPISHALRLDSIKYYGEHTPFILPRSLEFRYSSSMLINRTNIPYLSYEVTQRKIATEANKVVANYENMLVARYQVLSQTNLDNVTYPMSFELIVYGNKSALKLASYEGTVTNVTMETPAEYLPTIQGPINVSDYRFNDAMRHIDAISYTISNNIWTSTNDPILKDQFRKKQMGNPVYVDSPLNRLFTVVLFGLIILLPLLGLMWNKKKGYLTNPK